MSYEPTTWATGDIITATKLNNIESGVQSVNSSYTPTTWVTGDIITAVKLNNIEQGIANAGGGGSSDFSTAQVTLNFTLPQGTTIAEAALGGASFPYPNENLCYATDVIADSLTANIILYQSIGKILYFYASDTSDNHYEWYPSDVSVSGDAYYDSEENCIVVTGDCTVTITIS